MQFRRERHRARSAGLVACNRDDRDPRRIVLRRVIDLNDRALRDIFVGLGGVSNGVPRRDGFDITPACEIMAILCLCRDSLDLGERLSNMVVAFTYRGEPVYARDLKAVGAMAALLRDALKPNVVATTAADALGRYCFLLQTPGEFSLVASSRTGSFAPVGPVAIAAGETRQQDLSAGTARLPNKVSAASQVLLIEK